MFRLLTEPSSGGFYAYKVNQCIDVVHICSFSDIKTPEDGSVKSRNICRGFFNVLKHYEVFENKKVQPVGVFE
jgi:hypothetical protein